MKGGIQFASRDSIKAASSWMITHYTEAFKRLAQSKSEKNMEESITPTASANPESCISITMHITEAYYIVASLERAMEAHRKGLWGHWDCPPNYNDTINHLKAAVRAKSPDLANEWWGTQPSARRDDEN